MEIVAARAGQQDRRIIKSGSCEPVGQCGQDRRGGHIAGHVRLGVVGAFLFLAFVGEVDVLLEDEAENIGVDLFGVARRGLVEMPAPSIEEVEQRLERLVADLNVVGGLQLVRLENAAVDIRHRADDRLNSSVSVAAVGFTQALMEERQQELLVERVELIGAETLPHHPQTRAEITLIVVQEPFLLDEVDEHQPVQQHRRIPSALLAGRDPLHPHREVLVVLLELTVEGLGHLVSVERATHPGQHRTGGEARLLVDPERRLRQPLQQGLGGRLHGIVVGHQPVADPARALLGPQPQVPVGRGEHYELVAAEPFEAAHHPMLLRAQGQTVGALQQPRGDAALVGCRHRAQRAVGHRHRLAPLGVVPSHPAEQRAEIALSQQRRQLSGQHSAHPAPVVVIHMPHHQANQATKPECPGLIQPQPTPRSTIWPGCGTSPHDSSVCLGICALSSICLKVWEKRRSGKLRRADARSLHW